MTAASKPERVTPAGNGTALPKVDAAGVGAWYQRQAPVYGWAVFGPSWAWDGTTTVSAPAATSSDWQWARLQYTTGDGSVVDTALYGAGAWQIQSTDYDEQGRTIRSLDERATASIRATGETEDPARVDAMSNETRYTTAGLVSDEYGPVHDVTAFFQPFHGMRTHTAYTYNEGRPAGKTLDLLTSTTTWAYDVGASDNGGQAAGDKTLTRWTLTGYDPVEPGDPSGWDTGQATTTTSRQVWFADPANDITHTTRYDTTGRVIETRQPLSTGSTHPGTRHTAYYTTGTNPTPGCGNNPAWDGQICRVWFGDPAAPTGTTTTYTYTPDGQPAIVTDTTTDGTTRTTTTGYDTAGRATGTTITLTGPGATGSTARSATTLTYSPTTGALTTVTATDTNETLTVTTDGWGRTSTYTNQYNETATTTYVPNGAVATISDPRGTLTYTYDGTDANGATERRGAPTTLTVTRGAAAGTLTWRAAYDPAGAPTRQDMPGATRATYTYDPVGELTELAYHGQVTPYTETTDPLTGETTWTPGTPGTGPWLVWSRSYTSLGEVSGEWNGAGAAFDGLPGVTDPTLANAPTAGAALASEKSYTYDHAGRLTNVIDRTATNTGVTLTGQGQDTPETACTKRDYTFDKNGNRTRLVTANHSGGVCFYAATSHDTTTTYNTSDTPLTAAAPAGGPAGTPYTHDPLGRALTIPATDTPDPARGDITLTYYHDDLIHSITQAGATTTYTLDPAGRRATAVTTGATTPATDGTSIRHYTNPSDNPTWITTNGTTTRATPSLTGGLGAQIGEDGTTQIALPNPHGDNVTTLYLPPTTSETTPTTTTAGWADYDEYGNTKTGTPLGNGYGHLGQAQRATTPETAGLTLMGARLYNPITAHFTTKDPIHGGNTTTYTYPNDPINQSDTTGLMWSWVWKGIMYGFEHALEWACKCIAPAVAFLCGGIAGFIAGGISYIGESMWVTHSRWTWGGAFRYALSGMAQSIGLDRFKRTTWGQAMLSKARGYLDRIGTWAVGRLRAMSYFGLAGLLLSFSSGLAILFAPDRAVTGNGQRYR